MDPITDWIVRLDWILVAWLFALGGVVGSFLNVVVYRLPSGKSIVYPGSCCPACGHPIRWYHNLPIVSWLLLRGRCYDCRAKISPRYPLVELMTAVLFVVLFQTDIWRPLHPSGYEMISPPLLAGIDVVVRYVGDLWLMCSLLCAALIEIDRARVPRRIFLLAMVVAIAAAAAFPLARLRIPAGPTPEWASAPAVRALTIAIVGLAAGGMVGIVLQTSSLRPLMAGRREKPQSTTSEVSIALGMACGGAFLGWVAAILAGVVATISLVVARRCNRQECALSRLGWSTFAFVAALAWIIAARCISPALPLTPGP